jgi:hypothetical protein
MPKRAAVDSLGVVTAWKGCASDLVKEKNLDGKHAGDRSAEV